MKAQAEGLGSRAGRDHLQPGADVFRLRPPCAKPSGISGPRHVAEAMHSALQRKDPSVEPGSGEVGWQEPLPLQSGDPGDLAVDVAVASAALVRPLEFLSRPVCGELGQIDQVGTLVRRLHVEECRLPVFARLDDLGHDALILAGCGQAAAAVGHILGVCHLASLCGSWHCLSGSGHVSSEVEEALEESYARSAAEIALTQSDETRKGHYEIGC